LFFQKKSAGEKDIYMAQQAFHRARKAMSSNKYDIVIMDEVCVALFFALLKTQYVLSLLEEKPGNIELILTGRYCPPEQVDRVIAEKECVWKTLNKFAMHAYPSTNFLISFCGMFSFEMSLFVV
jgi:ATP:corrinoid adenosyltransferase